MLAQIGGGATPRQILDIVYPIGILVEFAKNVDPNDIMLGQKWELYGQGKTTVCKDPGSINFYSLGKSVGAETHTLTVNEMPSHKHNPIMAASWGNENSDHGGPAWTSDDLPYICTAQQNKQDSWRGGTTGATGGGQSHNNIQPSIVVLRWQRTA